MQRSSQSPANQCRQNLSQRIHDRAGEADAFAFFNLLTSPELFEQVEALTPPFRERVFPPTETLAMFLAQVMDDDGSCRKVVDAAAVKRLVHGLPRCSSHTGAFCRARQRLPLEMIRTLARHTGARISEAAPVQWRWHNRPVRIVDGTTVIMPDTPANQALYPQPCSQKPGLGFPQCRVVGITCLASGSVLNAAMGPVKGKGSGEQSLLRSILDTLNSGDVLLGDAYFATYFLLCELQRRGVDAVFEQYGARRRGSNWREERSLGDNDRVITLSKPKQQPDWMDDEAYASACPTLSVREVRVGRKTLVTTLLCPQQTSRAALRALYRDRWHIELDLRHIKTTMGMNLLRCRTPEMVQKEFWVYLLAYNLIRLLMAQAAAVVQVHPRQISFRHTLQVWLVWSPIGGHIDDPRVLERLFVLIGQHRVGNRAGRTEPRALKRRPSKHPLLTVPRAQARSQSFPDNLEQELK